MIQSTLQILTNRFPGHTFAFKPLPMMSTTRDYILIIDGAEVSFDVNELKTFVDPNSGNIDYRIAEFLSTVVVDHI